MSDITTEDGQAMPVRPSDRPLAPNGSLQRFEIAAPARRRLRLLMVEDNEDDADLLLRELRHGHFDVTWERVQTATAMRRRK